MIPGPETLIALVATFVAHSTLLLGTAWLITRKLGAPRLRELLWKGALVGALVTTGVQAQIRSGPLTIHSLTEARSNAPRSVDGGSQAGVIGLELPEGVTLPETEADATGLFGLLSRPSEPGAESGPNLLLVLLVLGWILWAAFRVGRLLLEHRRLTRALSGRRGFSSGPLFDRLRSLGDGHVRLSCAPGLCSPMAIGRREICLPSYAEDELDPSSQSAMLAHELAHLERRDGAWLLFANLLECLFPFQPLLRVATRRIYQDAELLCDESALRRTGDGLALARCLATVAERFQGPAPPTWAAAMAATPSELVLRVERVLGERPRALGRGSVLATSVLGLSALAVLACAGPRVVSGTAAAAVEARPERSHDVADAVDVYIDVAKVGTRSHTGLNGGTPEIPWVEGHKGLSAGVGREVFYRVGGYRVLDSEFALPSLVDFVGLATDGDLAHPLAVHPSAGALREEVDGVIHAFRRAGYTSLDLISPTGQSYGREYVPSGESQVEPPPEEHEEVASSARLAGLGYLGVESADAEELAALGDPMEDDEQPTGRWFQAGQPAGARKNEGARREAAGLPVPAITITIGEMGGISIDGRELVAAGSPDLGPLRTYLSAAATRLTRTQLMPGTDLMLVEDPVRLAPDDVTPFRRVLEIMQVLGLREVLMPHLQLEVPMPTGMNHAVAIPLPMNLIQAAVEELPPDEIEFRSHGSVWTVVVPGQEPLEMVLESMGHDAEQEFYRLTETIKTEHRSSPIVFDIRGPTTAFEVRLLIAVLKRRGVGNELRFIGTH